MKKPTLVVLGGFAGAGKTTIARKLSADFNLLLISTDELNDALRKTLDFDFRTASPHAHDVAWSLVRRYLQNGVTVLLDTNMCNDRTWSNVDEIRDSMPEVDVLTLILECSIEVHKKRVDHRGKTDAAHLNLGGEAFEDTLHKYDYIKNLNHPDLIRINAEGPIETVYEAVTTQLRGTLAGARFRASKQSC